MTHVPLYTLRGDDEGDNFGRSVAIVGDISGDGLDDLVAGANGDDNNGAQSGSVRAFSGLTGNAIYTLDGNSSRAGFGFSISRTADLDDDGIDDFIVGTPSDSDGFQSNGTARFVSATSGDTIFTHTW